MQKSIIYIVILIILLVVTVGFVCNDKNGTTKSFGEVTKINEKEYLIYSSVLIDAPAEDVWAVVSDFDNLSSWNSFFIGLEGEKFDGGQITNIYNVQGNISRTERTFIYEEGVKFGWYSVEPNDFGFTSRHEYIVKPVSDNKAELIQTNEINKVSPDASEAVIEGILDLLFPLYINFNLSLKREVTSRK